MSISFIILFYNDKQTAKQLIQDVDITLSKLFNDYEIIAIDDNSTDDTFSELISLKAEIKNLIAIKNEKNLGVGKNFRKAVEISQKKFIGYTDGDYQYDLNDLEKYKKLISEYDVVTGYRKKRQDKWHRTILSKHFNYLTNSLFSLQLKDVNSALKIYNASKLKLLPEWDSGAFYDAEILMRLKKDFGASICEVAINHKKREHGIARGFSRKNINNILENMVSERTAIYRTASTKNSLLQLYVKSILLFTRKGSMD